MKGLFDRTSLPVLISCQNLIDVVEKRIVVSCTKGWKINRFLKRWSHDQNDLGLLEFSYSATKTKFVIDLYYNMWRSFDQINQFLKHFKIYSQWPPYPEIGDASFKCTLWTFKQQLASKNVSALWNFYCSPINIFVLHFSDYEDSVGQEAIRRFFLSNVLKPTKKQMGISNTDFFISMYSTRRTWFLICAFWDFFT